MILISIPIQRPYAEQFEEELMRTEYTDFSDAKHRVEHITLSVRDKTAEEQIISDLLRTLTKAK